MIPLLDTIVSSAGRGAPFASASSLPHAVRLIASPCRAEDGGAAASVEGSIQDVESLLQRLDLMLAAPRALLPRQPPVHAERTVLLEDRQGVLVCTTKGCPRAGGRPNRATKQKNLGGT